MPWALAIGPAAALIGIGAIFFVLRRKSVDKRSMYSARRSQIEHKVRAARQRTLTPHGRAERPEETAAASAGASPFGTQAPAATYEASAYEPPPAAPAPTGRGIPDAPSSSPWDVGPVAPPSEQFAPPAPPPAFEPAPSEEVWTPAPAPAPPEPLTPVAPARPAIAAASPAAWSVVGEAKASASTAESEPKKKKKGKEQEAAAAGSWQLASGNAPGAEPDEDEGVIRAPGQTVAIAQYAVLVVGLVAVLIGVLIMVAGSPVK
jgi:hypothetical protein